MPLQAISSHVAAPSPGRRTLLRCLAACMGTVVAPGAWTAPPQAMDELRGVMQALTGTGLPSAELGRQYLAVLRENLEPETLRQLAAIGALSGAEFLAASQSGPLQEAAEFAMLLWITGMTPASARSGANVLAYASAPVWQTLRFTKPPGQCGGAFGYWSQAPRA